MGTWIEELADMDAATLAGRLGLSTCPLCSHETTDRRGRLGSLRFNGPLWLCHACNEGGNGVGLLSAAVLGTKRIQGRAGWRRLRTAAGALGVGDRVQLVAPVKIERLHQARANVAEACAYEAREAGVPCKWSELYDMAMACIRDGALEDRVEAERLRLVELYSMNGRNPVLAAMRAALAEEVKQEREEARCSVKSR